MKNATMPATEKRDKISFEVLCPIQLSNYHHNSMKLDNCIEVKYVNGLSVPYLTRFFGSVGPVVKVHKEQVSKYVTIQFAHKNSVDKALRFNGRVLDQYPIKIRRCREKSISELRQTQQKKSQEDKLGCFSPGRTPSQVHWSAEDLWGLIQNEIKPHRLQDNQQMLLGMLIWGLLDLLISGAKHIKKFRVSMRYRYLMLELEKLIIDRITRKNAKVVTISQPSKAMIQLKDTSALVWFNVPFPNIEEEQTKIEAASVLSKCKQTIKEHLSLRLSEVIQSLHAAALCYNPEQTRAQEFYSQSSSLHTTQEDSFIGVIENLGSKNIFYEYLANEVPNTCIYLRDNKTLTTFESSLRLKGCRGAQLKDSAWCNLYRGTVSKKEIGEQKVAYSIEAKERIESICLDEEVVIFEHGQFSLQQLQLELKTLREISEFKGTVVYLAKEQALQKYHEFKNIYQDELLKIQEQVEEVQIKEREPFQNREVSGNHLQRLTEIILIQIKCQNSSACNVCLMQVNTLKLTHYLEDYVQDSVLSKGLIIASREMAIKLAANIIEREKENRLFEFGDRKYQQYVGQQLWRVYNRQGERKAKNLLAKYTRERT